MFYIDVDLKTSAIYIFPVKQVKEHLYVIRLATRYKADQLLRKLNSGQIRKIEEGALFEQKGTIRLAEQDYVLYDFLG